MMNVQDTMKDFFGHSCCAYCYAYLILKTPDYKSMTRYLLEGWSLGYLDDDAFVSKPVQFLKLLGLKCKDIQKIKINSLSELPTEGDFVVEYKNPHGGSHFVVANRQGVVFDPSDPSDSVKMGVILSYRKIIC